MEKLEAKIDGLKELMNEKFNENKEDHIKVWTKVDLTNGRVRLLEKAVWGIGGAVSILALLFSPSAVSAVSAVISLFK